jgi:hypothetical protein
MDTLHNMNQDFQQDEFYEDNFTPDPASIEKRKRLMQQAMYWLGVGVLLMGISFGINFFMYKDGVTFVTTTMYVLTTLGAACIIKALVNIFN